MLKTYITTVPLQGKLDPMLYQRDHAARPTATCFPIVQVMRDTLEPGDTVQLLAIRQENADTADNAAFFAAPTGKLTDTGQNVLKHG